MALTLRQPLLLLTSCAKVAKRQRVLAGLGEVLGRHRIEKYGVLSSRTFLVALLPRPIRAR